MPSEYGVCGAPGSLAADCSPVLDPGAIRRFKYGFALGQITEDGAAREAAIALRNFLQDLV